MAKREDVIMSRRVIALQYVHAEDGKRYSHDFDAGVEMVARGDYEIVLRRRDGQPLSEDFIV